MFRHSLPPLALAVLALCLAPPAAASPATDARAIVKGLRASVASGRLTGAEAARHRLTLRRARAVLKLLPGTRASNLAAVLHGVAVQSRRLNRPRSVALFGMLELNAEYLGLRALPPSGEDVFDDEGVLYRSFPGHGLQFHPLGNFGRLNGLWAAGRNGDAGVLAHALLDRAIPASGARSLWEYYFPFGGGRPPWTSGMSQSVGAAALARAGERLADRRLLTAAKRAYRSVPGRLTMRLSAGPWIRHYSFSGLVVLNAHLQAALSLGDYAEISGDRNAVAFAARMRRTAVAMIPRFDTGYWTRYSLGRESALKYHLFVIRILRRLARVTGEQFWGATAVRFDGYTQEPPLFRVAPLPDVLYPRPVDGFRDVARIKFWVSKISRVTLRIGGEPRTLWLSHGWHTLYWNPGRRRPGVYTGTLTAVDLAGNIGRRALDPIEIKVDRTPPEITATVTRKRLTWTAKDPETPWIRLTLHLRRGASHKILSLGARPHSGKARIDVPRGTWRVTLVAADSSGNRTRVPLGELAPAT
ncbi:MAG: D-glucuronyl C5-epimerase family protein [Gaiellaceae bacterium]